jgi:hypothetical protein
VIRRAQPFLLEKLAEGPLGFIEHPACHHLMTLVAFALEPGEGAIEQHQQRDQ